MNIQNNRAAEVLYSTTYVEDYLDTVETLPEEVQRLVTRLIALDADAQSYLQKVRDYFAQLVRLNKRNKRNGNEELVKEIGRVNGLITVTLMKSQEVGDEKIQVAQQLQDLVDNRLRQLEIDRKTLDSVQKQADAAEAAATSSFSSRDRDSAQQQQQRSNASELSTSERSLKRVRRVRLGPSIMPRKPEVTSTSAVPHVTAVGEKRSEATLAATPSKHDIPASAPSTPHVEKVKEKVKTSSQHTPTPAAGTPASSSQEHRKDSSASSSSTALPAKKRTTEAEVVASTSAQAETTKPEVVEKKSEVVLRTPKKKEKKVQQQAQKSSERKAAAASSSSTTKRTAAKRKAQQVGAFADIDPDEPTYCVCDQISYGDMIGCDNDLCPIEWFHFSCVQLSIKPKGKWYCPTCRDGKPNVMKTKEAFLKELEKYNREREGR